MKDTIPIYLVSLQKDTQRRETLQKNFTRYYDKMEIIDAVDSEQISAKKYFYDTLPYYKKYKKLMSPSELGCTLSHIEALKRFLKTDEEMALIFEDDIIGSDEDLDKLKDITKSLPKNSLLILGGLDGLSTKYLLGKESKFNKNLMKIPKSLFPNLNRTCCYIVTRQSAKIILDSHNKLLNIADKWDVLFLNTSIDIYFTKLLKHPFVNANSNIEEERGLAKVKRMKLPIKELKRVERRIIVLYYKILGYKKLY